MGWGRGSFGSCSAWRRNEVGGSYRIFCNLCSELHLEKSRKHPQKNPKSGRLITAQKIKFSVKDFFNTSSVNVNNSARN